MTTLGRLGIDRLQEMWQDRNVEDSPRREGLVIGGGGARASFEIGALLYLYEHTDIEPDTMVGTSAGSIVTATLAQYATHDEQFTALQGLADIWTSMVSSEEMFAPRQWYSILKSYAPQIQSAIPASMLDSDEDVDDPPQTVDEDRTWFKLPDIDLPAALRGRWGPKPPKERLHHDPADEVEQPHPLLGFGPEDADYVDAEWRASDVWQVVGALPGLSRVTSEVPAILKGAEQTRAMYRPGSVLQKLLSPAFFSPTRMVASGITVRIAAVCLETGELRFMDQHGQLRDRHDTPLDKPRQDVVMGLLSSCTIPGGFSPVPMAGEHYVDGGVRENLPVEMAIAHLGVQNPWVIVANPLGNRRDKHAGTGNLIDLLFRVIDIFTDESQRDEVSYAESMGARIIQPIVDVHDPETVDPGLIDINMAYGWMRAQEVVLGLDDEAIALHHDITVARRRVWELEDILHGASARQGGTKVDVEQLMVELIEQKFLLRDMVASATHPLPVGAASWWSSWEKHPYPIERKPGWVR